MIDTAVILAAGKGTRFGKLTENKPKGFIEFRGVPMVVRSIESLLAAGIKHIITGTGFQDKWYRDLADSYPEIVCCYNDRYATTNSMWTLSGCAAAIDNRDFLLLESDIIYERRAIDILLRSTSPNVMLVAPVTKFQDNYFVERDVDGNYVRCSTDATALNVCGELVGIHKISGKFYNTMCNQYLPVRDAHANVGYEFILSQVAKTIPLRVELVTDLQWYEMDDWADLDYAEHNICLFQQE